MNSRAFGLNLGKDKLLIRVLDDKIADLADEDVVARALAAVFVRVDANELFMKTDDAGAADDVDGGGAVVTIDDETEVVREVDCCCLGFLDLGDEPLLLLLVLLFVSFFLLFFFSALASFLRP